MQPFDAPPRRSGFTAGDEEEIWHGSPALRSSAYRWIVSIFVAMVMSLLWKMAITGAYQRGMLNLPPDVLHYILKSPTELTNLMTLLPWAACLFPVLWYTLNLAAISYSLTTQRITVRSGILVRTLDQVELFQVRDFTIGAPLHYAIMGLGHVHVVSTDQTLPFLTLIAQPKAADLVNLIRKQTQRRKDEVGMREIGTNTGFL